MTTQSDATEQDSTLNDYLCFALYSTNHSMNRAYLPLLKDLGLTYPQYLVMVILWQQESQHVGEIGRQLFLDSNTLTPMLKRLEALGLIERNRDPEDERQVRVSLTDSGKELRDKSSCIPENILKSMGITMEELRDLTTRLQKLRANLRASI